MNSRLRFLLARFVYVITFLLVVSTSSKVYAQPQYYVSSTSNGNITDYPLNSVLNKTQWIYQPNQFRLNGDTTKTAAPYGKINRLYIKLGGVVDTNNIYSEFTIKLGQHIGTASSWATTNWDTTLEVVFYKSEFVIPGSKHSWVSFDLPNTFIYDPTKSIVVEISSTTGVGVQIQSLSSTNSSALIGQSTADKGIWTNNNLVNVGFDFEDWESNNAGITKLFGPTVFCSGRHNIEIELVNNGRNPIDSVQINWSLDDTLRTPFWYSKTIDTFGSTNGNIVLLNLGSDTFPSGKQKRLIVWTTNPNSKMDSITSDDTLDILLQPAMSGRYTLGDSSKDYQSFQVLSSDLNQFGVCGPVTITIDSGTYTDRLWLNNIPGTNSKDTILIRGAKRADCILQNKANSVYNQQNILLNGTSFITIRDLTICVLDSFLGVGIQLINTGYIQIDHCNINMIKTSLSSNLFGIAGLGAKYNMYGRGYGGHHSSFLNNTIQGGNYSLSSKGAGKSGPVQFTNIRNNKLEDFNTIGLRLSEMRELYVVNNSITGLSGSESDGLEIYSSNQLFINANKINEVKRGLLLNSIGNFNKANTPSIVSNNMVVTPLTGFNSCGIVSSSKIFLYHNSFSSSGWNSIEIARIDSCDIRNNIFNNSSGKIVLHLDDTGSLYAGNIIDFNSYYCPLNTRYPFAVRIGRTYFNTVQDWFRADTSINKNSFNQKPGFKSNTDLHIDSTGDLNGSVLHVTHDFDGDIRCSALPTVGADQFIPGIGADVLKPDKICRTGCLTYTLPNIKRYPNANYGTDWRFDSVRISTSSGYTHTNFTLTTPSSSGGGTISFCPDSTELDSLFKVFLVYQDLNVTSCYNTFTAYALVTDVPDGSFTLSEKELCYGDTLRVTSKSNFLTDSVIFDMGDGYKKANANFHYEYDNYGNYTIKKYIASNGCEDSSQTVVKVGGVIGAKLVEGHPKQGKTRTGKLRDPDYLCTLDTTYYQVYPPKTISRYTYDSLWKIKWVSLATLGGTPVHDTLTIVPDSFNGYRISVYPSDQFLGDTLFLQVRIISPIHNRCDTTLSRYITLRKSPRVGFTSTKFCKGETITFRDTTAASANIIDRFWNFHDGHTSIKVTDTHTYHKAGWQTVSLANLSKNGCHGYAVKRVRINPRTDVRFISSDTCAQQTVLFQDSSHTYGSNHRYLWQFSDGSFKTGKQVEHTFDSAGLHQTTLYVTDSMGCIDSAVSTSAILHKPKADFILVDSCLNEEVRFSNMSSDTFNSNYAWRFTAKDSSDSKHPTFLFSQQPSKPIRLILTNSNGCSDTIEKQIRLDTVPDLSFSYKITNTYEVQFTPSDSAGLLFKWYFGDGDSSTETSPTHNYSSFPAGYLVKCVVTTKQNCGTSTSDSIRLGNQSVDLTNWTNYNVFPNPFNNVIKIQVQGNSTNVQQLHLVNVLGQTKRLNYSKSGKEIVATDLSGLAPGVYVLVIQTETQTYQVKMVKQE